MGKLDGRRWNKQILHKIVAEQRAMIAKEHGKDAARDANYGWGQAGDDTDVSFATKVYAPASKVLVSSATYPSVDVVHKWTDYSEWKTRSLS